MNHLEKNGVYRGDDLRLRCEHDNPLAEYCAMCEVRDTAKTALVYVVSLWALVAVVLGMTIGYMIAKGNM